MKTIALKEDEYKELKALKYHLCVDTYQEAVVKLMTFYKQQQHLEVPA